MTPLETALVELATALEDRGLPYVLIGGLAVSLSGEPRATLDVDISVWAAPERMDAAVEFLCTRFRALRASPSGRTRASRRGSWLCVDGSFR